MAYADQRFPAHNLLTRELEYPYLESIINIYTKTLQEKDNANSDPQQARASSSVAASYLYGYLYVYQYSYHEYRYQSTLVPVGLYTVPVALFY